MNSRRASSLQYCADRSQTRYLLFWVFYYFIFWNMIWFCFFSYLGKVWNLARYEKYSIIFLITMIWYPYLLIFVFTLKWLLLVLIEFPVHEIPLGPIHIETSLREVYKLKLNKKQSKKEIRICITMQTRYNYYSNLTPSFSQTRFPHSLFIFTLIILYTLEKINANPYFLPFSF